jgi:hypothetical protein
MGRAQRSRALEELLRHDREELRGAGGSMVTLISSVSAAGWRVGSAKREPEQGAGAEETVRSLDEAAARQHRFGWAPLPTCSPADGEVVAKPPRR